MGLARLKQKRDEAIANLAEPFRLKLAAVVATNPGDLRMLTYIPPGLPPGAPLVVVLHGCTQNAAAYDHGAGWSTLAERHGFALLFPEQQRANNPNLCWNWFQPDDVTAGRGEVESIRQMVLQITATHHLDARRVYITGLSAGGAMTAAMLATSPDLFAAGAIIAGLPFGAASGVMDAMTAMRQPRHHSGHVWGNLVRAASPYRGPRPAVQIWHGAADATVDPANAVELAHQWADVLGLPAAPATHHKTDSCRHDVWQEQDGRTTLERWIIPGLDHGTPIRPAANGATDADQAVGTPGPHMLASSVSSTWHLASSWGLLTQPARPLTASTAAPPAKPALAQLATKNAVAIERVLKAAGLLPK